MNWLVVCLRPLFYTKTFLTGDRKDTDIVIKKFNEQIFPPNSEFSQGVPPFQNVISLPLLSPPLVAGAMTLGVS
jgi:hypothetical protein